MSIQGYVCEPSQLSRYAVVSNLSVGSQGSAGTLYVYPSTAGDGKIKIAAANSAGDYTLTITNASQAAARTYTIPDAGRDSNFMLGSLAVVSASASANTSLTAAQSGSLVVIPQSTASVSIQLPAVASGLRYRFLFTAQSDGSHTTTIQVGSGTVGALAGWIYNFVLTTNAPALKAAHSTTNGGIVNPATTIVRSATAADTKAGDFLECFCDGTNYYFTGSGVAANAAGPTFTVT